MDIYFEMAKHPVFTIEDVNLFYNNMNSARSGDGVLRCVRSGVL